jgi:hypothetical protein
MRRVAIKTTRFSHYPVFTRCGFNGMLKRAGDTFD